MRFFSKLLTLVFLITLTNNVVGQSSDTLRLMAYNLLAYRASLTGCTSSNNNTSQKESYMTTIVDYTLPDIILACEIGGGNAVNSFRLLSNSLNQNGRNNYQMANPSGIGQSMVNMLYFNTNKFVLESQTVVDKDLNNANIVRDIDIYTLYYNDPNLAVNNDTTYFHIIGAHLKASNSSASRAERAKATEAVMAYLDTINATGNYFFMGDLNLYRSSEAAFLDLVNYTKPALRFHDPVNSIGSWNNNSSFSAVQTQSTRTSGGCGASGGMDDRFDWILTSDEVLNNNDKVEYINGSYQALGQDGNRFNGAINNPSNQSVPSNVVNALFGLSDHLPVMMDVKVDLPASNGVVTRDANWNIQYNNPVQERLRLNLKGNKDKLSQVEILDISGKILVKKEVFSNIIEIDINHLFNGTYFIRITSRDGAIKVEKLIKI